MVSSNPPGVGVVFQADAASDGRSLQLLNVIDKHSQPLPVMEADRDDVLAFMHLPQEHWRKIWSTNPLERLTIVT